MFNSNLVSGLAAGFPLAVIVGAYWLWRGRAFVAFMAEDGGLGGLTFGQAYGLFLGMFVLMALGFGLAAGWVYGWLGSKSTFLGLALGLATLFSVLAIVSRTPLPWDKVFMNFAVAGVLGLLVPFLAVN